MFCANGVSIAYDAHVCDPRRAAERPTTPAARQPGDLFGEGPVRIVVAIPYGDGIPIIVQHELPARGQIPANAGSCGNQIIARAGL